MLKGKQGLPQLLEPIWNWANRQIRTNLPDYPAVGANAKTNALGNALSVAATGL